MAKTHEEVDTVDTGADSAENRVYELGFHLDPELPQEEVKKAYQAVREVIAGAGTIVAEGEPLKIPLAYTISRQDTTGRRDFDSAYFSWVVYEADTAGHAKVNTFASEEKRIIRFLDVKTTPEQAKHSAEMHELFAKGPEMAPREDEEVSEVELDAALKSASAEAA